MASPGIELGRKASFLRPVLCSTNKNAPQRTKTPRRELRGFFVCGATRNRTGDTRLVFYAQSFALPIKRPAENKNAPQRTARLLCLWCHQESNRGHKAKFLRPVLCSINKNAPQRLRGVSKVVPPGIEPGTQGFSVLCSTN